MFSVLRTYTPWFATTVISIILILLNSNPHVDGLRGRIGDLIEFGSRPVTGIMEAVNIWRENERLRALLAEMSLELASLEEDRLENDRLRHMLGFRERSTLEIISSEVIGFSPDIYMRGVIINRGYRNGIQNNQAAVTSEGIVGRVYRVGNHTAVVQTIHDPNFGIAGRILSSRENGIVHATDKRRLRIDGVPVSSEVIIGDSVVTSGLGGIFPQGLGIGVIKSYKPAANGWLWEIELEPCVNTGSLEELFILQGSISD